MKAKTRATSDTLLPSTMSNDKKLSSVNAGSMFDLLRFGKPWSLAV